jgi:hypothetical protein
LSATLQPNALLPSESVILVSAHPSTRVLVEIYEDRTLDSDHPISQLLKIHQSHSRHIETAAQTSKLFTHTVTQIKIKTSIHHHLEALRAYFYSTCISLC